MADNFKVPGSSYDEVIKIIKAYASGKSGQAYGLDDIAQLSGMDKTIVSRNNGFLLCIELITEGNKKSPTDNCLNLGRAYSLNMTDEIRKNWAIIIEKNEFLTKMLTAIKIRNGMDKASFINHILYSAGGATNKVAKTGANTVIEIYKAAGLVEEVDGKINACVVDAFNEETSNNAEVRSEKSVDKPEPTLNMTPVAAMTKNAEGHRINININIEAKVDELEVLSEKIKQLIKSIEE
ncbi:MAG: hypothetical protein ACI4E5_03235 [Suilimivivens sp.]